MVSAAGVPVSRGDNARRLKASHRASEAVSRSVRRPRQALAMSGEPESAHARHPARAPGLARARLGTQRQKLGWHRPERRWVTDRLELLVTMPAGCQQDPHSTPACVSLTAQWASLGIRREGSGGKEEGIEKIRRESREKQTIIHFD
jgi:hypothetical protein